VSNNFLINRPSNIHDLQLLVDDARRCLQMNFEAVQKHSLEIYQSALVWIPKESLIRKIYVQTSAEYQKSFLDYPTHGVQQSLLCKMGLVNSVAFSQDGSRVVSGSEDNTGPIWNATTGEVEAELKGHTDWVTSVAFSQDGSRVVSGSDDKTVRIWNATTGEVEAELKGHTELGDGLSHSPRTAAESSLDHRQTVRIWNATTGEVEAELKGHTDWVTSVAFSQDGSRVVSGSVDKRSESGMRRRAR
jgi:WD40 repeat protein